jgi:glycolate oxidase FAD binding subunit
LVTERAVWRELSAAEAAALAVDGVAPTYACEPSSYEQAGAAVADAAEQGLAVVPRGAGNGMAMGFPPSAADLIVSTTRLNKVIAYEPADLTLTVEAGISLGAVRRLLGEHGQFLALDPPGPDEATIGGVLACNASGPLRLAYGTARDLVIGTRVANTDGQVTKAGGRVVKNVAGYDLNKLHIGALGTLGILVEVSFKLHPLPRSRATLAAWFADLEAARHAVAQTLRSPLNPQGIELLDAPAARLVGLDGDREGYVLLIQAAGFERAVERQVRDLADLCAAQGGTPLPRPDDESSLWKRVRDLACASEGDVLARAAVPIAETGEMIASFRKGAQQHGVAPVVHAHAGSGIVFARYSEGVNDDAGRAALARCLAAAREAAVRCGGSLVIEAAPTPFKAHFDVWGEVGSSFRVMQAIKQQLDPRRLLNPGRYVGRL